MFNSTHTFVGIAIARTGLDDWVPYAAVTAVIASNLPDIDIVTAAGGMPAYIDHHRGFTHTIAGVGVLSLLLAAAMFYFSGRFWRTFVVALAVMATHPLLDFANTYGLRPFLPFDGTWYYGDVLFIIDPYLDGLLLFGILWGIDGKKSRKPAAWIALALVTAYVGARIELHSLAASQLGQFVARTPGADKWAVFPTMLNPFAWEGIVRTNNQMLKVDVHALNGVQGELARLSRGSPSPIVDMAAKTESADVLMQFARFPVSHVEGLRFGAAGYRVLLFDFRFYNERTRMSLGSEIVLDESLHVVKESLSFGQPIN